MKTTRLEQLLLALENAVHLSQEAMQEAMQEAIEENRGGDSGTVASKGRALALVKTKIEEARMWAEEARAPHNPT